MSTSHSHTELSGKLVFSLSFFLCLCSRVCLAITFLIQSLQLFLSPPFVLFPDHTFPLFPLLIPETYRKACYYFYFLSVCLKAVPVGCCHNLCLLYVEI